MGIEKEGVAENRVAAEDADIVGPLDWCLSVTPDHLLHLENALRYMHRKRDTALARCVAAVAQQLRGAVLDLHWRDDPGQPPARVALGLVDERQRRLKTLAPALLVPGELQIEIIGEAPARRRVAGGEKAAHAAPGEEIEPAVPGGRDVDERSDATQQQLAIGELRTGRARLVVGCCKSLRALVEPGHMHVVQAMLLAHPAVERLVLRMGMNVDQPGQYQTILTVDDPVRRPGIISADKDDHIVGKGDVDIAPIALTPGAFVPGDDQSALR